MLSLVLFLYSFLVYVFTCFLFFYFFACLYVDINLHLLHLDIFLLCWILLVQNMSSFCCIVFLFIIVVMCSLLSCLFLFFYPFFPIVVQMSFIIDTCAFFSLMYTLEENDDQSYSSSPILVFSQFFFALYFIDACISCNTLYLYCILFKCTYLVSLPLKETFEWKKTCF